MPDYRRAYIPGGTYFFTVKSEHNAPIFQDAAAAASLGAILRKARQHWPMSTSAVVLLPDHLHVIWSLPPGDNRYSMRWAWIKKEFTKQYLARGGTEQHVSNSRKRHRRREVWQRKFWEHAIRDEEDFQAHVDYIHWNPMKHGYSTCPSHWEYSSFQRWVDAGVYEADWGCGDKQLKTVSPITNAGE